MPFGTEVGLGPDDIVLDGVPAPTRQNGQSPPPCQFSAHVYCGQTAGWIKVALGIEVGLGPTRLCKMGTQLPSPKVGQILPIFSPFLLWPNGCGWMHQGATWHGGRPQPRQVCVKWGPSPTPQKWAEPPIFSPRFLWPNGCMDQDTTWYGGDIVLDGDPAPPPLKGHSPQFSVSVHCGQMAGWAEMPLAMEIGVGPGNFVLDGDPATPRRRAHPPPPNFWPMSVVVKRLDGSRCHLVRR